MANDLIMKGKDRLHEIAMKLDQSHLVYLQTDDSPLKLKQRRKLEGFIKEYLCLVPNDNKYVFHETADILHRSAATLQDFSGYRAATAWSAISLYAANLLAQPWRKEYRTLRTYSGYYKHEVEANLIEAELMFEQMGYKHTGLDVLTLEGPIDPDKVSSVSKDAIVAFVECQILKQIWETVSHNYTISWLEVLEFRENHVGTPEQAIRALNYRFLEKIHQNRVKTENYKSTDVATTSVPYHIIPSGYNIPLSTCQLEADYTYAENTNAIPGNCRYFQPIEHGFMNRCSAYGCLSHGNKYLSGGNPYYSTMPGYARVPTGRLIELDMPTSVANYDKLHNRLMSHRISNLDEVDSYRKQSNDADHYDCGKIDKTSSKSVNERNNYDSWDFVYRNLESLGYSKDLGDREDILHKRECDSRFPKQKLSKQNEKEDKYTSHRFEKRKGGKIAENEMNLSVTNGRHHHHHHSTLPIKKESSPVDLMDSNRYHDITSESLLPPRNTEKAHGSQTLPIQHSHRLSHQMVKVANTLKNVDLSQPESESGMENSSLKWNCATCTYLNSSSREICEMCGKSRHKGNEDKPLASGGKECPKCTLVNEKNVSTCDACGVSLKDSPTYI